MSIGRFLADELARPLGVEEDYYIEVPEEADSRVSLLIQGTRYRPAQRQPIAWTW